MFQLPARRLLALLLPLRGLSLLSPPQLAALRRLGRRLLQSARWWREQPRRKQRAIGSTELEEKKSFSFQDSFSGRAVLPQLNCGRTTLSTTLVCPKEIRGWEEEERVNDEVNPEHRWRADR